MRDRHLQYLIKLCSLYIINLKQVLMKKSNRKDKCSSIIIKMIKSLSNYLNYYIETKQLQMKNQISWRYGKLKYQISLIEKDRLQMKIMDENEKKNYKTIIHRRSAQILGGDFYQAIYKQWIWDSKEPKQLLSINHDTFQILLDLRYLKKKFTFKFIQEQAEISQQEIAFQKQLQEIATNIINRFTQQYTQNIKKIQNQSLRQIKSNQIQNLQQLNRTAEQLEKKLQKFVDNKITQTDESFKQFLIESNQYIEQKIKITQRNLVSCYSKIVDQVHLITEGLSKNIEVCTENFEKLSKIIVDLQNQQENSLSKVNQKLDDLSHQLKEKINEKTLFKTLQKLHLVRLKPNHQIKSNGQYEYQAINQGFSVYYQFQFMFMNQQQRAYLHYKFELPNFKENNVDYLYIDDDPYMKQDDFDFIKDNQKTSYKYQAKLLKNDFNINQTNHLSEKNHHFK